MLIERHFLFPLPLTFPINSKETCTCYVCSVPEKLCLPYQNKSDSFRIPSTLESRALFFSDFCVFTIHHCIIHILSI